MSDVGDILNMLCEDEFDFEFMTEMYALDDYKEEYEEALELFKEEENYDEARYSLVAKAMRGEEVTIREKEEDDDKKDSDSDYEEENESKESSSDEEEEEELTPLTPEEKFKILDNLNCDDMDSDTDMDADASQETISKKNFREATKFVKARTGGKIGLLSVSSFTRGKNKMEETQLEQGQFVPFEFFGAVVVYLCAAIDIPEECMKIILSFMVSNADKIYNEVIKKVNLLFRDVLFYTTYHSKEGGGQMIECIWNNTEDDELHSKTYKVKSIPDYTVPEEVLLPQRINNEYARDDWTSLFVQCGDDMKQILRNIPHCICFVIMQIESGHETNPMLLNYWKLLNETETAFDYAIFMLVFMTEVFNVYFKRLFESQKDTSGKKRNLKVKVDYGPKKRKKREEIRVVLECCNTLFGFNVMPDSNEGGGCTIFQEIVKVMRHDIQTFDCKNIMQSVLDCLPVKADGTFDWVQFGRRGFHNYGYDYSVFNKIRDHQQFRRGKGVYLQVVPHAKCQVAITGHRGWQDCYVNDDILSYTYVWRKQHTKINEFSLNGVLLRNVAELPNVEMVGQLPTIRYYSRWVPLLTCKPTPIHMVIPGVDIVRVSHDDICNIVEQMCHDILKSYDIVTGEYQKQFYWPERSDSEHVFVLLMSMFIILQEKRRMYHDYPGYQKVTMWTNWLRNFDRFVDIDYIFSIKKHFKSYQETFTTKASTRVKHKLYDDKFKLFFQWMKHQELDQTKNDLIMTYFDFMCCEIRRNLKIIALNDPPRHVDVFYTNIHVYSRYYSRRGPVYTQRFNKVMILDSKLQVVVMNHKLGFPVITRAARRLWQMDYFRHQPTRPLLTIKDHEGVEHKVLFDITKDGNFKIPGVKHNSQKNASGKLFTTLLRSFATYKETFNQLPDLNNVFASKKHYPKKPSYFAKVYWVDDNDRVRGCVWACLYAVYRENNDLNIHVPCSMEKKLLDIPTVLEKRPREDDVVFMETKTQEEILQEQLENAGKNGEVVDCTI